MMIHSLFRGFILAILLFEGHPLQHLLLLLVFPLPALLYLPLRQAFTHDAYIPHVFIVVSNQSILRVYLRHKFLLTLLRGVEASFICDVLEHHFHATLFQTLCQLEQVFGRDAPHSVVLFEVHHLEDIGWIVNVFYFFYSISLSNFQIVHLQTMYSFLRCVKVK